MAKKSVKPNSGGPNDEDEDEELDSSEDESADDSDGEDEDGDGSAGDGDEDAGTGDDDEESELDRVKRRMKAADRRAAELQRQLREAQDKDKPADERLKARVTELEEENAELKAELPKIRLQSAFLEITEHDWHNRSTALSTAQSEGYLDDVVEDDGTVDKSGLKRAMTRLAKEHSYLIKPKDKPPAKDQAATSQGGKEKVNKPTDKATREKELRGRVPALSRPR